MKNNGTKSSEVLNSEYQARAERFDKLLPIDADELTIILKGHLLIEEQLRAIIRALVANPEHLDEARLTFANSLHLARAVAGHFNKGVCWSAAKQLNVVRNLIAH